ncbi:hypothetical protein J0S82_011332 [Galemys pyrenaicus]|uniref:Uncharacterized protein n=1 Tax=Galemys pyrenaicus TaxID=202257 RepID=A0A8J6DHB2_GALPY|nr:hypothetical protein J0S82_011332 [Galemys pyrenaicus]
MRVSRRRANPGPERHPSPARLAGPQDTRSPRSLRPALAAAPSRGSLRPKRGPRAGVTKTILPELGARVGGWPPSVLSEPPLHPRLQQGDLGWGARPSVSGSESGRAKRAGEAGTAAGLGDALLGALATRRGHQEGDEAPRAGGKTARARPQDPPAAGACAGRRRPLAGSPEPASPPAPARRGGRWEPGGAPPGSGARSRGPALLPAAPRIFQIESPELNILETCPRAHVQTAHLWTPLDTESTESAGQSGGDPPGRAGSDAAPEGPGACAQRSAAAPPSSPRDAPGDSAGSGNREGAAAGAAGKMPVAVMAESAFSFKKLLDQCENQELEVALRGRRASRGDPSRPGGAGLQGNGAWPRGAPGGRGAAERGGRRGWAPRPDSPDSRASRWFVFTV